MATGTGIVDPRLPQVTWKNINDVCLLVVENPINVWLRLMSAESGLSVIYNPRGNRYPNGEKREYIEAYWYPRLIAQTLVDKYHEDEEAHKIETVFKWFQLLLADAKSQGVSRFHWRQIKQATLEADREGSEHRSHQGRFSSALWRFLHRQWSRSCS